MIASYRNFLRWIADYQSDEEILKSAHYRAYVKAIKDFAKMIMEDKNNG